MSRKTHENEDVDDAMNDRDFELGAALEEMFPGVGQGVGAVQDDDVIKVHRWRTRCR